MLVGTMLLFVDFFGIIVPDNEHGRGGPGKYAGNKERMFLYILIQPCVSRFSVPSSAAPTRWRHLCERPPSQRFQNSDLVFANH